MAGAEADRQAAPGGDGPLTAGLAAFAARDLPGAHAAFERAHRIDPREPRAMSWYGVTLVLVEKNITLGVSLCDAALRVAPDDAELLLNSARVHVALRQRQRAARDALGTRRPPVIPFLPRANPLNRLLGRLRHRWTTRHQPAYDRAPESLGLLVDPDAPPRS